jgi:hypothetical protein
MEDAMTLEKIQSAFWFTRLPLSQKELLQQSFYLLEDVNLHARTFFDYSFIIMPAAKAYEGFVKDLLFQLDLITANEYNGIRFRIGKALNPELAIRYPQKYGILYDDLERIFGGPHIAAQLWATWKACRNEVFHYFVKADHSITLEAALGKLNMIVDTIIKTDQAVATAHKGFTSIS